MKQELNRTCPKKWLLKKTTWNRGTLFSHQEPCRRYLKSKFFLSLTALFRNHYNGHNYVLMNYLPISSLNKLQHAESAFDH